MKLEFGTIPSAYNNLPRLLVHLERTKRSDRAFILGRLYQGYVGLIWITRLFELDVWIHKPI